VRLDIFLRQITAWNKRSYNVITSY